MPRINPPPEPQNQKFFDPWNSAATGHQRHASVYAGSASWKDTRALKLARQMRSGDCLLEGDADGDKTARAFDGVCTPDIGLESPSESKLETNGGDSVRHTVNGSGEWRWVKDDEARRSRLGVRDIRSFMGVGKRKADDISKLPLEKKAKLVDDGRERERAVLPLPLKAKSTSISNSTPTSTSSSSKFASTSTEKSPQKSKIFTGTTIYINGSTLPKISDHKLKHLLVHNGAKISISMTRKSVTHVVVGAPNAVGVGAGAGGGLSARKMQLEIGRGGWKGVRVVGVDWALESVEAGRRLAESRFEVLHVAEKGQRSIAGMFSR
ncbi:hypothetical protein N7495_008820 [Penicillium taxi]|uniref:uncharacterized protein n=1 Tax=Penicillium taxi TaxID=168475 RepID=UPI00254599D0|nr:uncharacterized protein N7495_008820 [Penicillium taxi]KAJ5888779.1 hypothetical protein N7495_008820 [Penicillium taxi]